MAALIWKHGKTKAEVVEAVRRAITEAGYDTSVKWDGAKLEARVGPFASIVHVKGEVTDDAIVLDKCGGLAGGRVLSRCRELLERLLPGGEQLPALTHPPGALPASG